MPVWSVGLRRCPMRRVTVAVCALVLPAALFAQSKDRRPGAGLTNDEIERYIRAIMTAKNPSGGDGLGAADSYRAMFTALGPEWVRALQAHANDAIAVQAAWEDVAADRRSREWFIGFLEGRTRLEPPDWWSAMFVHGLPVRRGK